jgi:hemoglobin
MILAVGKSAEITEESIRRLVDAFYVKVRADAALGPIFATAIPGDWQPHLEKMVAFWSSVMLTSGRYKGNPVAKHLVIPGMTPELFTRWLALFDATCRELFDEDARRKPETRAVLSTGSAMAARDQRMTFVDTDNGIVQMLRYGRTSRSSAPSPPTPGLRRRRQQAGSLFFARPRVGRLKRRI